jgi:hypothetical protein
MSLIETKVDEGAEETACEHYRIRATYEIQRPKNNASNHESQREIPVCEHEKIMR